MKVADLKNWLIANRVRPDVVSVNVGIPDAFLAFCIVKNGDRWEVYYCERGTKNGLKTYDSEDAACADLINRLREDPYAWLD